MADDDDLVVLKRFNASSVRGQTESCENANESGKEKMGLIKWPMFF